MPEPGNAVVLAPSPLCGDLTPLPKTYTYASLIDRMRAEALRFK
jgi:hypothetical protein